MRVSFKFQLTDLYRFYWDKKVPSLRVILNSNAIAFFNEILLLTFFIEKGFDCAQPDNAGYLVNWLFG